MGTGKQGDCRVREPGRERHLWLSLPLMGGGWSGWPELGQGTGGGGGGGGAEDVRFCWARQPEWREIVLLEQPTLTRNCTTSKDFFRVCHLVRRYKRRIQIFHSQQSKGYDRVTLPLLPKSRIEPVTSRTDTVTWV